MLFTLKASAVSRNLFSFQRELYYILKVHYLNVLSEHLEIITLLRVLSLLPLYTHLWIEKGNGSEQARVVKINR